MTSVLTDSFETGLGAWTQSGATTRLSNPTTVANLGTRSYLVDNSSTTSAWLAKDIVDVSALVARFYLRVLTAPTGTTMLYQGSNASGDMRIAINSSRVLRAYIDTTFTAGPTLALNQWYRVDVRFTGLVSPATAVIDWQVDGVAQTQHTRLQALNSVTAVQLGFLTSVGGAIYFDDIALDNNTAAYPIGPVPIANPATATGTGASNTVAPSVKATADRPTGTGMTWQGTTGELRIVSIGASGATDPIDAVPDLQVAPAPTVAAGTGAVGTSHASVTTPLSTPAGTGAAYNIARPLVVTNPEISSGLGAAADISTSNALSVAATLGSGTGAGVNATVTTQQTAEPGLTIQMGM